MTLGGRLATLFPVAHLSVIGVAIGGFCTEPGVFTALAVLAAVYLFPVACFRLHEAFFPLTFGRSSLSEPKYSPWWGGFQMQTLFIAMPWLEGILRCIPGAYSAWLRLWGSRVGKGVVWTPRIEITDRSMLRIGDNVVLGHESKYLPHLVRRTSKGDLELYLQPITIGSNVVVGAGSRLGPGVVVEDGVRLKILTDVHPDVRLARGTTTKPREIIGEQREGVPVEAPAT